jgi:ferric-dicitrate binding protein FerR (iron transport regulator)
MPDQTIAKLIDRLLDGTITSEERELLAQWILRDSNDMELQSVMKQAWHDFKPRESLPADRADQILDSVMHKVHQVPDQAIPTLQAPVRRIRTYWIAAAMLLFIIFTGAGFYLHRKQRGSAPVAFNTKDVAPPTTSRAVLTLSDGSRIVLDSAGKGNIATQRSTSVVKEGDGNIAYRTDGKPTDIEYNTLTVPRGSRIAQVTLSDGTRVWLNAGSSIRYPVAFNGPGRKVEVTGESYFEVAQDKDHPFVVTNGKNEITVLGTHFNVNAYNEEGPMKVTLLEGSVRISTGIYKNLLLPGQLATMEPGEKIDVEKNADIERIMAWKNGYFNYSGADIRTVMRELARWYGLELDFENVTREKFHIEISRDIPLSKVLRILEMTDKIHFTISGNKVTVLP